MTQGILALSRSEQIQAGLFAIPEDQELDQLSPTQVWCTECESWVEPEMQLDMFGGLAICPNCGAEF